MTLFGIGNSISVSNNSTNNVLLSQKTMKKKMNFIFSIKYVIPKSLKVVHWLSQT